MVTYEELVAELREIAGKKYLEGFKSVAEMVRDWGVSDGEVRKLLFKARDCECLQVSRRVEPRLDGALKSVPIYKIIEKKKGRK